MRQPTLLFILKGEMDWHRKQQTCALEAQFNRPLRSLSLQIDLYLGERPNSRPTIRVALYGQEKDRECQRP